MKAREGSTPPHRDPGRRDQSESAFSAILGDLVTRVSGARAAALVDRDGETVDYAGEGSPFEMRVAAAHFRIVLDETRSQPSLRAARSLVVHAARASFAVHSLPDGYALVVRMTRGAGFRGLGRAVASCIRALAEEAGWASDPVAWYPIEVVSDERGTPRTARAAPVAGAESLDPDVPLEVLGRYRSALPAQERAWRVRIPSGVELTLVREPGGFWYADQPVTLARAVPAPSGRRSKNPLTGGRP
jgi:hypothetical protein